MTHHPAAPASPAELSIAGMGILTDSIAHIRDLAPPRAQIRWANAFSRVNAVSPLNASAHDALSQLALHALNQAYAMADLAGTDPERVALLVQSSWGNIDSTAAYLDSMFEAGGRYASPRHFARSVYSSIASVAAIHFGIKGPCETVAFDEAPLLGPLRHAWRLLAARRAERVAIVWCEQAGALATDLAQKAAHQLHRKEFDRYASSGLGQGAIAIVVAVDQGLTTLALAPWEESAFPLASEQHKPFAMDSAVGLLKYLCDR